MRAYYNLERLWSTDASNQDHGLVQGQVIIFSSFTIVGLNNTSFQISLSEIYIMLGFGQGIFEGSPQE